LVKPLVSEKGYRQMTLGQYGFRVSTKANKISIAKAVEKVYDVKVARVNIINVMGKARKYGKTQGRTSDWKKAIVTLKKGQTIAGAQA
jgi:large subunit ribosomal protein L23